MVTCDDDPGSNAGLEESSAQGPPRKGRGDRAGPGVSSAQGRPGNACGVLPSNAKPAPAEQVPPLGTSEAER